MLTVNLSANLRPQLKELVTDLRRGHNSKYPVHAESREQEGVVYFTDPRLPMPDLGASWKPYVAILFFDGITYTLRSRLISNNKFAPHNDRFYTVSTQDQSRMLKALRKYVLPFSLAEIAKKTEDVGYDKRDWAGNVRNSLYELAQVGNHQVIEEVIHLTQVGVQFKTRGFRELSEKCVEMQTEARRREGFAANHVDMFVFVTESDVQAGVFGKGSEVGDFTGKVWLFSDINSLPSFMQQQIAVLKLFEPGKYLPEVGRKESDTSFWIHVSKDDLKQLGT
jgi:hypothetical protein